MIGIRRRAMRRKRQDLAVLGALWTLGGSATASMLANATGWHHAHLLAILARLENGLYVTSDWAYPEGGSLPRTRLYELAGGTR